MFGKGKSQMSSTDKFVMGKGRAAGNLKDAGPAFNKPLRKAPVTGAPMKGQKPVPQKKQFKSRALHTTGAFRK